MTDPRAQTMARLYAEDGLSMAEIGERYGVTRQRIAQILAPFDLETHHGRRKREERARALKEAHARIVAGESTAVEESARLGYRARTSIYTAFAQLGLSFIRREVKHGTYSSYSGGCRCPECRKANRDRMRELRQSAEPPEHGTASGYFNYGCRCAACKEAARKQTRDAKARDRQAKAPTV